MAYDVLIVGAGIYGITAALELRRRGHTVGVLNPDTIPHLLAASTDISKAVRMEYGADTEYMEMGDESISGWHAWNEEFGETLYHEWGIAFFTRQPIDAGQNSYEWQSYQNLLKRGYQPELLGPDEIARRFPAWNNQNYVNCCYNPRGGFVESGRMVETLARHARSLGVDIHEGQTADVLLRAGARVVGVKTREGATFSAGHVVVCAGAYTQYLVPELQQYMRATGHPVFHLKPSRPELFTPPNFCNFGADVSNSGWYGFPLHPRAGVVKIANHGRGQLLHPEHDERVVTEHDTARLRAFLAETFPALANDPIVYTRRCLYCDTLDEHFWIDRHPEVEGLSVAAGGSGHALKMAPLLGGLIASAAEGKTEKWSHKFRWRELSEQTAGEEASRYHE